jgi:hypothetical protein
VKADVGVVQVIQHERFGAYIGLGCFTGWPSPTGGVVHTAAARWGGQATTQVALEALTSEPVTIPFPVATRALVAKAKTGSVELTAAAEPPADATHTVVATEGGTWDEYEPVGAGTGPPLVPVAQLRVLRKPFPGENTPLLDLVWVSPAGAGVQAEAGTTAVAVGMGRRPTGRGPSLR